MHKSICKRLLLGLLALTLGGTATQVHAQAVIFPQEQQPGSAQLSETNGKYTLRNDLFSVSFVKAEGKLTFGGCGAAGRLKGESFRTGGALRGRHFVNQFCAESSAFHE